MSSGCSALRWLPRRRARLLGGRSVLNVNSTATGGGVAEMLQALLSYARGAGVDARWLVIEGDPEFFADHEAGSTMAFTARPGTAARSVTSSASTTRGRCGETPTRCWRSSGLVMWFCCTIRNLLGFCRPCGGQGRSWCGAATSAATRRTQWTERSWQFLRPYIEDADALVFSRRVFAPIGRNPQGRTWCRRRSSRSRPRTSPCLHETCGWCSPTSASSKATEAPPIVPFMRRDGSPAASPACRCDRTADHHQSPDAPYHPASLPLGLA